jgi:hypothetical protein
VKALRDDRAALGVAAGRFFHAGNNSSRRGRAIVCSIPGRRSAGVVIRPGFSRA